MQPDNNNNTQNSAQPGGATPAAPMGTAPATDQNTPVTVAPVASMPTADTTMGTANPVEEKKEETGEMPGGTGTPPTVPPATQGM